MAYDKNQMVMHQLQVKAKRLDSGLRRLVEALKAGGDNVLARDGMVLSSYHYALGCLGGDYLKKELFKTDAFEDVMIQLKGQKFVKADTADKNIALWREKHKDAPVVAVPEGPGEDNDTRADETDDVDPKMREITIVAIPEESETVPASREFGTRDADGNIVPRESTQTAEYAEPVPCENKFGRRQSFGGNGSDGSQRRVIECY